MSLAKSSPMEKLLAVCVLNHHNVPSAVTHYVSASPALVEVAFTASKGLGLFATKDIKRGTRILAEEPLVVRPPTEKSTINIYREFDKLTPPQLNEFSALHHEKTLLEPQLRPIIRHRMSTTKQYRGQSLDLAVEDEIKMRAVYNTNMVGLGLEGQFGDGVFPLYSRINHSCTPNVHHCYNPVARKGAVHAAGDIAKGEEILTTYIPLLHTRDQRQGLLKPYGFKCDCKACEGPLFAHHEANRERLYDIDQRFAVLQKGGSLPASLMKSETQVLLWAEEMVDLLKKEGLVGIDLSNA